MSGQSTYGALCVSCQGDLGQLDRPRVCPRCGQLSTAVDVVCDTCRDSDRTPQGEALALFTPAPAVMAGQEGLF
jgi:predicted amidophosphoribosyltransferase